MGYSPWGYKELDIIEWLSRSTRLDIVFKRHFLLLIVRKEESCTPRNDFSKISSHCFWALLVAKAHSNPNWIQPLGCWTHQSNFNSRELEPSLKLQKWFWGPFWSLLFANKCWCNKCLQGWQSWFEACFYYSKIVNVHWNLPKPPLGLVCNRHHPQWQYRVQFLQKFWEQWISSWGIQPEHDRQNMVNTAWSPSG